VTNSSERIAVIVLAAGSSSRMGGIDKIWADLGGVPLLAHSLRAASMLADLTDVVVVSSGVRHADIAALASKVGAAVRCVEGGTRRQDSVARGIEAAPEADYYLVHDGARPLASAALFTRVLDAARMHGAVVPAVPVVDTVKRVDGHGRVLETVDRSALVTVQTPQGFAGALLRRAHHEVMADATDDASMVEALGEPVVTVAGESANLKVTTPRDLMIARALLAAASRADGSEG
jgi:2-C-methyl-D-erythritol 4-phosphate cytidylyltransferase